MQTNEKKEGYPAAPVQPTTHIKSWQERLAPAVSPEAQAMGAIENAMADEIAELRATLAALVQPVAVPAGWISMDEREPEEGQHVIIKFWPYNNRENQQIEGIADYIDGSFLNHEGDTMHPPSHWMPFPAAPSPVAEQKGEQQAAPEQAELITDEQIKALANANRGPNGLLLKDISFARAVERQVLTTQASTRAAERDAALEEAISLCAAIGQKYRDQYKGRGEYAPNNPRRADPHCDGCADGAWECEAAIDALKSTSSAASQTNGGE